MHKFDGDGTLAHGGGNAFDRAVTHIAGHENAGDIRFEQIGITLAEANSAGGGRSRSNQGRTK